ncbi:MAG: hypothetical protein V4484_22365 [Pseudomonadota bacterium]
MAQLLSKTLFALAMSMAVTTLCVTPAQANETTKPVKAKAKSKAKVESHPKAVDVVAGKAVAEEDEPDVSNNKVANFSCELNNAVTIYSNDGDAEHIGLRWKKRLHRLTRVGTTTGAQRYENRNYGLVWINIPSKGMLLDSRQNRQLANECKNPEQTEFVPQAPSSAPESTLIK